MSKVFISYKRGVREDEALVSIISSALKAEEVDVFVDTSMPVGTYWSPEIQSRIEWCNYFILILSQIGRAHV